MMKKLLIAGGVAVVLVIAAVAFLASNLDSIVEKAIELIGPEMTGVSVKVNKVTIGLTDGRGQIEGLAVGNPKGYKAPHAVQLGSIALGIDPATVAKDVIVIRELTINAPNMVYEKGAGGSNVDVIQRNVDAYAKKHFGSGQAQKKGDAPRETRFIVEKLQIRNGRMRVVAIPGKDLDVALPPVALRDIGKARGGATASEIASVVVKQMTQGAISSATRAIAQEGTQRAKDGLRGLLPGR